MTTERELEGQIPNPNADPIDFFHTFVGDAAPPQPPPPSSNFKLNLGLSLSLGGFSGFGIDEKSIQTRNEDEILSRSTSIPAVEEVGSSSLIARTCSLPLESEEERRRRKEMQSLKRMEAKRKREEKMKKAKEFVRKDEGSVLEDGDDVNREDVGGLNCEKVKNGAVLNGEIGKWVKPVKQGSIGSQASSEFDGKQKQGVVEEGPRETELKQVQAIPPSKPSTSKIGTEEGATPPKGEANKEAERNIMDEMPCVTTREPRPNGQKIEGFLYKYRNGADIRIVCVCHGKFLTPAEFVAHGGGREVQNPLRHIVISSTANGFL